jgi:asparagine synthase (glutamine-hydrolysing)
MIIKILNNTIHFNKAELTYSGSHFQCWFTGYFFYQSKFYFSKEACILIEKLFIADRKHVRELNGIFECVLMDEEMQRIFLINDRFGFNQLFYYATDNTAIISNDFWDMKRTAGITEMDRTSVLELLQYRFVSGKYTLAEGIYCLEPSSILEINFSQKIIKLTHEEYWQLKYNPQDISIADAEEKLYQCLNSIIARFCTHLFDDKTIGINLTGGLDSRYVVALLLNNGIQKEHIKAFTYGSPDSEDIRYSTQTARAFGIEHTPILFDDNFEDFFEKNHIDKLLHDIGFYSYYFPAYGVNRVLPYYNNVDFLLSGYDGFYMGLKATPELFNLRTKDELLNYIYSLNATILNADQCNSLLRISESGIREKLISRIEEKIDPGMDPVSNFFNWTIKNRNRKYLLGVYKMQNRNTRHLLTFYDYDFMDLMTSLPYEALKDQQSYINSMFRKVFTGRFEHLSKIPADQRGKLIQVKTNFVAPRQRKYTLKKLLKKIFNSFDKEYNYPIRQQFSKNKVFRGVIKMVDSSESELLDNNKVVRYILKYRKSEYFARYGLQVLISILRFENIFKKVNP